MARLFKYETVGLDSAEEYASQLTPSGAKWETTVILDSTSLTFYSAEKPQQYSERRWILTTLENEKIELFAGAGAVFILSL